MRNVILGMVVVMVMLCGCNPAAGLPEPTATGIGTPVGAAVSAMIGAAGGTVKTADNRLSVKIPAGALSADTTITLQPITNTSHGARGLAYELTPDGQTFTTPVELSLTYSDEDVAGSAPEFLTWAVQDADGLWEVQDSTLDTEARTLTVSTTHFSRWSPGIDIEIMPSISTVRTGTQKRFVVQMCSFRPLGRDAAGLSHSRFTCSPASTTFAANVLGPWMVNGVAGGNSTLGTVRGPELVDYRAPDEVPTPDTVFVSANVTAYDGKKSTPIGVKVRVVAAGTSYGGRYDFTQSYGTLSITGWVDFVWTPRKNEPDIVTYSATTGLVNAHFEAPDCDPLDLVLQAEGATMTLYTAAHVSLTRQYHFAGSATLMVGLKCGSPRVEVTHSVGLLISGGVCNTPPPFASFTDERVLRGNESCSFGTASWVFDALD